jgi:DNA-3-methyladenine glycosylase
VRRSFYSRPVLEVARDLIGCVVSHGGSAGVIVETEAYHHSEPACHAFVGLTNRTRVLFGPAGIAYVYRSYGIHAMLNAVSEPPGVGAAVLIRALEPVDGIEAMRSRRGAGLGLSDLCSGPGKLTQALDIGLSLNGTELVSGAGGPIEIAPRPRAWRDPHVLTGPRVGITKAVELPWRFGVAGNGYVSRPGLPRAAVVRPVGRTGASAGAPAAESGAA